MRPTAVAIIALLLAASGCSASNETGTTAPQATTGAATEQPPVSTSTTQGPVALSEAEGALVVSVQTHDPDGVWVGWPEADILKFAHSVCRIADDVAYITEADPSLPPGQYLIGALNPPEATPRDQIRIGAMLGALIQTPLCSPQGTEVVEEAVLFMMRSSG